MKDNNHFIIYKKVDISTLTLGITIPMRFYQDFPLGMGLRIGDTKGVNIVWDGKRYSAKLNHSRTRHTEYLQLRYDTSPNLLKKLRKTFFQSYVILKSQKELFDSTEKRRQFRSQLQGGQQEVLKLQPLNLDTIRFTVFIRVNNAWNTLFQRLADENVFAWMFDADKKYLITRSTPWLKAKDFGKHKHANNVIYFLAHTKKKLLYIGKAGTLGTRVKPGRKHQEMLEDLDLFRYDVIKPEFSGILERIEDHTIRAVAAILSNDKNYSSLNISQYKLANRKWVKL